jgi:preprotein translocase subunit YajC
MESPQVPMSTATLLMQATPAGSAEPSGTTSILMGIVPWLLIFVIFYMLMIRPQQRRVKEHQAAIDAVKKGDEVITGGGIRGRVTKVGDDEAEVEVAQGVKIRVIKSTISQVLTPKSNPAND